MIVWILTIYLGGLGLALPWVRYIAAKNWSTYWTADAQSPLAGRTGYWVTVFFTAAAWPLILAAWALATLRRK